MNQNNEIYQEITYPNGYINVANFMPFTRAHGPGNRFSLWLQGCLKRCVGCINGHMLNIKTAKLMSKDQILTEIYRARDSVINVNGITLQGGEPTLQARNLMPIIEDVKMKQKNPMNVLLFTGYTIDFLQSLHNQAVNDLLSLSDTIIDGEYEEDKKDYELIRGSTNQKIIFTTDALKTANFKRKAQEYGIENKKEGISYITSGIKY